VSAAPAGGVAAGREPDAFGRRLRRGVALAIAGVVITAATLVVAVVVSREADSWAAHSRELSRIAREVGALARDRETGIRGYLLTGDRRSLQPDSAAAEPLRAALDSLVALTADNPSQQRRARRLTAAIARWDEQFASPVRRGDRSLPGGASASATALAGKPLFDEVRQALADFLSAEEALYGSRRARALTSAAAFATLVLGELTVLAVLLYRYGRMLTEQGTTIAEQQHALESQAIELELQSEDLQRSNAQLGAANEELQSFADSVAHDLRAPLRTMNGFAGMLAADHAAVLGEEGHRMLARIRTAANHAGKLIDGLLALARLRRDELTAERVDLSAMAAQVVGDLQQAEPDRRMDVRIAPGLTVTGDPALLEVVLQNLIGNAWKFTRDTAAPRLEIGRADGAGGAGATARDAPYLVRDNGVGFDPAFAGQLFGMFTRLHPTEFPGTGIGLATVRRIIERHGGGVWAEGRVGEGATFYFTIPDPNGASRRAS
jgi:signal transduction histidine kinase